MAHTYNQDTILIQVISLEKKIEILHTTRGMQNRAERLTAEANEVQERRKTITQLSNLSLLLYSWFVKNGHARSEKDEAGIKHFFHQQLHPNAHKQTGFYEKMYLCQSYFWYAFIRQDYLMAYRYTQ